MCKIYCINWIVLFSFSANITFLSFFIHFIIHPHCSINNSFNKQYLYGRSTKVGLLVLFLFFAYKNIIVATIKHNKKYHNFCFYMSYIGNSISFICSTLPSWFESIDDTQQKHSAKKGSSSSNKTKQNSLSSSIFFVFLQLYTDDVSSINIFFIILWEMGVSAIFSFFWHVHSLNNFYWDYYLRTIKHHCKRIWIMYMFHMWRGRNLTTICRACVWCVHVEV